MYHYTSCGLKDIWLVNGVTHMETVYGRATSIHDLEGLHKAIGSHIINNHPVLTGEDIRFLRKELDLSQIHMATLLGVTEASVRGWERGRHKITKPADKLLRVMYADKIGGNKEAMAFFERLSQLNHDEYICQLRLEETQNGWKEAA